MALHVKTGAGAPNQVPLTVGEHYIDTTNDDHYLSIGTASSADWRLTVPARARINAQTGTAYTLTAADNGKAVTLDNSAAITLTLPQEITADLVDGFQCDLVQLGAGQVTVATEGTDTLISLANNSSIAGQGGRVHVVKLVSGAPASWGLSGDLA